MIYDCIVIGGGPASLSAVVYLGRANYKVAFIEKSAPGGKVVNTGDVENYLGYKSLPGPDLAFQFFNHAINVGAKYIGENAIRIKLDNSIFEICTNVSTYFSKSIIIATGTQERKLEVPGEKEYENKGVSWCAICDGPLFKNKTMTFIGGGNAAIGEALHVINFAKQINLIHRRDFFRADKIIVEKLFSNKKVTPYLFYNVIQIKGEGNHVASIIIENNKTHKTLELETSVVFPYIGSTPNTKILESSNMENLLNKEKYIITNDSLQTKIKGLFAAGDVREKTMRQIATAVGDGALVSKFVIAYLEDGLWN